MKRLRRIQAIRQAIEMNSRDFAMVTCGKIIVSASAKNFKRTIVGKSHNKDTEAKVLEFLMARLNDDSHVLWTIH